jgi:hypothetical protein
MSSLLPKDHHDLSLAPVAVSIDRNLQGLRDIEPHGILVALEVVLDRPERTGSPDERAERIVEAVLRPSDQGKWHHGPVVQFGVHAGLSSRRSRVQIPSGPQGLAIGVQISVG